ncbi:MAG TPA: 3-phenylpropionate/cinnamic acid dioxygenase subunit beta [Caulobacteraceae bacterium]|jgi:biphenyl 2,3-dioxygenase beta subunit|nr:3-phenylpropionate/cinnamic acid dioxygenase subunit beta [Caulobacteraceae bacterium]
MTMLERTRPAAAAPASQLEASLPARVLLQHEVEQFLYAEAALLDARDYRAWLALLADDIRYWMPIRRTVMLADLDLEFTRPGEMAYFDDDRAMLEMRVRKLEAGSAWAEDPPSRSRHFVSNVRVMNVEGDEITLDVCFLLRRTRLESELTEWFGRREDMLRRVDDGFRLARRHIFLDQTVIPTTNMSTLF